jgi:hypothetical protein
VWSTRTGQICGLVNGRGSFGGLTGMVRFYSVQHTPVFHQDVEHLQFQQAWFQCQRDRWVQLHAGAEEPGFCGTELGKRRCYTVRIRDRVRTIRELEPPRRDRLAVGVQLDGDVAAAWQVLGDPFGQPLIVGDEAVEGGVIHGQGGIAAFGDKPLAQPALLLAAPSAHRREVRRGHHRQQVEAREEVGIGTGQGAIGESRARPPSGSSSRSKRVDRIVPGSPSG